MKAGHETQGVNHKFQRNSAEQFLTLLAKMSGSEVSLREMTYQHLAHLHYSFLILLDYDTLMELLPENNITVTPIPTEINMEMAIVSGSLDGWVHALFNGTASHVSFELRSMMNKILFHFDQLQLSQVFTRFRRKPFKDQTFGLEYK